MGGPAAAAARAERVVDRVHPVTGGARTAGGAQRSGAAAAFRRPPGLAMASNNWKFWSKPPRSGTRTGRPSTRNHSSLRTIHSSPRHKGCRVWKRRCSGWHSAQHGVKLGSILNAKPIAKACPHCGPPFHHRIAWHEQKAGKHLLLPPMPPWRAAFFILTSSAAWVRPRFRPWVVGVGVLGVREDTNHVTQLLHSLRE